MKNNFQLDFITQENLEFHVMQTIKEYNKSLELIDLKKFNKNIIDPIKLLFDKAVYNKNFDEIIKLEIQRQRDKSNNNVVGYFHQNIFKYFKNCIVPEHGWDVIFRSENKIFYVEMKNKHNTMNSSSSAKTLMKMQQHLLSSADKENSICALVEVIAKKSQDIPWIITLDGVKQNKNEKIRRISIDKFYGIVTGNSDSFNKLCNQLPITIKKVIDNNHELQANDTVIDELYKYDKELLLALYKLAFSTYDGFNF